MKVVLEFEFPKPCPCCPLRFIHTDIDENDAVGCGYLNCDDTESTVSRHRDCPLRPSDYNGYIGYEEHIRIGNEGSL